VPGPAERVSRTGDRGAVASGGGPRGHRGRRDLGGRRQVSRRDKSKKETREKKEMGGRRKRKPRCFKTCVSSSVGHVADELMRTVPHKP
jgi:hypothetical protein